MAGGAETSAGLRRTVAARKRVVEPHYLAFARVRPIALLSLRAALPGRVSRFEILPGQRLRAGVAVARLAGPKINSLLAAREAAVSSARVRLKTAREVLRVARGQYFGHWITRGALARLSGAASEARQTLRAAAAMLRATRAETLVKAPVSGTVVSLAVAEGERVSAGQVVLRLQAPGSLWLLAEFYGHDAAVIHRGMRGWFSPLGGSKSIPVRVVSILSLVRADGARGVGLLPQGRGSGWVAGEAGTVTLSGEPRTLVAVPTRALVLDRGRWWVLVRTRSGLARRAVIPGPSRGSETFLLGGLAPGAEVVVENVYLLFQRDFSKYYQAPD